MKNGCSKIDKIAVWAITNDGVKIGRRIASEIPNVDLYFPDALQKSDEAAYLFDSLSVRLREKFMSYDGHIFIMAAGIVVRCIAPLIRHKTVDPAVVVVDELGNHAISLLSGHIGGANRLAKQIASCIGARAVITTATDLRHVPAIDVIATDAGFFIENAGAIKKINAALIKGKKVAVYDPHGFICHRLPDSFYRKHHIDPLRKENGAGFSNAPGVYIDDRLAELKPEILILRPPTLVAGIGCNRNTSMQEIHSFLVKVFSSAALSMQSLIAIGTISLKKDETGLLALSEKLKRPLVFFSRQQLGQVKHIKTPSSVVEKHIGVKSVCEAAAILAAGQGELIVPKQTAPNLTVAVVRKSFTSSVSARGV
ncbi:MAG: cobalt-precorrin 5A hydrolase [Deltaproteobacteria bacterium]|nr:cobalt-precorrin 5A hydrolase [Deltaproteobacteria bacterium]MBW2153992.1 cobalt-precorrin 5A hydrolase [Deltaproteobacteria bacterium]